MSANFGDCLRAAMKDQQLSAAELSRIIDKHPQQVSTWMYQKSATTQTEKRVADALGLSLSEFWSYEEA